MVLLLNGVGLLYIRNRMAIWHLLIYKIFSHPLRKNEVVVTNEILLRFLLLVVLVLRLCLDSVRLVLLMLKGSFFISLLVGLVLILLILQVGLYIFFFFLVFFLVCVFFFSVCVCFFSVCVFFFSVCGFF